MYEDIMMRVQQGVITIYDVMAEYGQEAYDYISALL